MLTDEKTGVMYERWPAAVAEPKAILLLIHGLGAHSGRWEFLSGFMQERGVSCYALELRGFGLTPGTRGDIDYFDKYFADIRTLQSRIQKEHPGKKIFLAGESFGGLLAFLAAIEASKLFDGIICIAPAFWSRVKFTFFDYVKIYAALLYNPAKQFIVPIDTAMATRDNEYQKKIDTDPRECRMASARLLFNILMAQFRALIWKSRFNTAVLFLLPSNDLVVDSGVSVKVFNSLKVKDKKIIQYPDMCHALSVDLGKEQVFDDILEWIIIVGSKE